MKKAYKAPLSRVCLVEAEGFLAESGNSNQNTPDRSDEEGPNKTEIFNNVKAGLWD